MKKCAVIFFTAYMGWGKTTRLPFYLHSLCREKVYITLPSVALANSILHDLKTTN